LEEYSITLPINGAEAIYVGGIVDEWNGLVWWFYAIDGKTFRLTETLKIYLKNYNTADLIQQSRSHPQH
jgi:hypothetical protein